MPERAARMNQILGVLVDGKEHLGAAVVTRDGLPVASLASSPVSDDSFSAMSAALLGAAEAALQEWSDDRPARATIEGGRLRLEVVSLDNDFFLAAVSPMATNGASAEVNKAVAQLRALLKPVVVNR